MKRILVIGSGGSGKSTLSKNLGAKLGIEVFHLDKFYWRSGWVKPDSEEWIQTIEQLLARDEWIIDGNYGGTLMRRVQSCDTIVFLDLSKTVCLWRIFKRRLSYRQRTRPDMAEGCFERLDLEFVSWVLNYSRRSRPKVLELIRTSAADKKIVWLKSSQQVKAFLDSQELPSPEPSL